MFDSGKDGCRGLLFLLLLGGSMDNKGRRNIMLGGTNRKTLLFVDRDPESRAMTFARA